jgi:hypothetical protein
VTATTKNRPQHQQETEKQVSNTLFVPIPPTILAGLLISICIRSVSSQNRDKTKIRKHSSKRLSCLVRVTTPKAHHINRLEPIPAKRARNRGHPLVVNVLLEDLVGVDEVDLASER